MFGIKNRKKFLKSLQPGQIVRHQGLISNIVILFEFGHYDETEDKVYWHTARVQLGRQPEDDALTNTASVQFDGKLFEQVADNYKDGYSLASEKEIRRFEDVYDKFITGLYSEQTAISSRDTSISLYQKRGSSRVHIQGSSMLKLAQS